MEPKFVPVELCASDRQLSKPAMHGNIHCALKRTKSIGSKYHFAVLLQTFLLWEWAYNFIIVFLIIIRTDHKQVCAVCPSVHMTEPSTYSAVIFGELNSVILFNWYRLDFRKPERLGLLYMESKNNEILMNRIHVVVIRHANIIKINGARK